ADDQERLVSAAAVKARNQVSLAAVGAEDLGVGGVEPGVEQALAHGFGGEGGAAYGVGSVDFNQLSKDVAGEAAGGVVKLCAGRHRQKRRGACKSTEFSWKSHVCLCWQRSGGDGKRRSGLRDRKSKR